MTVSFGWGECNENFKTVRSIARVKMTSSINFRYIFIKNYLFNQRNMECKLFGLWFKWKEELFGQILNGGIDIFWCSFYRNWFYIVNIKEPKNTFSCDTFETLPEGCVHIKILPRNFWILNPKNYRVIYP